MKLRDNWQTNVYYMSIYPYIHVSTSPYIYPCTNISIYPCFIYPHPSHPMAPSLHGVGYLSQGPMEIWIYRYTYISPYIWYRSPHPVSHPGLHSTPLHAHRDGNVSAANSNKNCDTRVNLWPIICQNVIFYGKSVTPPMTMILYQYFVTVVQ